MEGQGRNLIMNYAILLSGGTGTRTGSEIPKQYVRRNGHMMITEALGALLQSPQIDKVVITADEAWQDEILKDIRTAELPTDRIIGFAMPGDTRQLSIFNAIEHILEITGNRSESIGHNIDSKDSISLNTEADDNNDTILVHDAARPYITQDLIAACYDALTGYDGVMPVLPMKDTVYLSEDGKGITGLLDRSKIYAGQAPELFRLKPYHMANRSLMPSDIYKINGASEPAVMAGMKIAMIPGDERNTKVTSAGDLEKFVEEKE